MNGFILAILMSNFFALSTNYYDWAVIPLILSTFGFLFFALDDYTFWFLGVKNGTWGTILVLISAVLSWIIIVRAWTWI